MALTTRINIRLSESLKERAKQQADAVGSPLSAYLAILIGEGVKKREDETMARLSAMEATMKKIEGFSEDDISAEMVAKIMKMYEGMER